MNQDGLKVVNSRTGNNRIEDTASPSNDYQMNDDFEIGMDPTKSLCDLLGWQLTVKNLNGQEIKVQVNFLLDKGKPKRQMINRYIW